MFNVRVYGILVNDAMQVLVADELIRGMKITKFCGGGLEKGEGTVDCLKREFLEEMNLRVEVTGHLYTTDFFQQSAFDPTHQVISIYYYVKPLDPLSITLRTSPFDFDEQQLKTYRETQETESFRFIDWNDFNEHSVTLPIDKIVASKLKLTLHASRFAFTTLENDRVRLEPLEEKHFVSLLPVALKQEIWQYTIARISSETDFYVYFREALHERAEGTSCAFAIFDKHSREYAGSTRFGSISKENKRMEIGWTWYAPHLQGSGINKSCKHLLLKYGFETLHLNRIELKTNLLNKRSQRAMEKIGAVKEGIFRNHIINADGSLRHSVFYSFIIEEWEETKRKYFES